MPDIAVFEQFHFLRPTWLLLLVPFALIAVFQWRVRSPEHKWRGVVAPHLLDALVVHGNQRSLFSPFMMSCLLLLLLALALAGPAWDRANSPFAEDQAPLFIAVDLSASMESSDIQPDRLQRARSKIVELIRGRGDAYTALYAYAGSGHSVLPLSNDADVALYFLDALRVGMLPRRGKSPESILPLLQRQKARLNQGGTLLLVGDGASEASTQAFGSFAEENDLQVLVWGIGMTREALRQSAQRIGDTSIPPLQEERLASIADATNGYYRRVSNDRADIDDIRRRIQRHYDSVDDSARPWVDRGYLLLPPILGVFVLWFRRGWALRW